MMTSDPAAATVLIRVEFETAAGDSRAIRRHCDDRSPEAVQETLEMTPRGALIDNIHIRHTGGEADE